MFVFLGYLAWMLGLRLIALSVITYALIPSQSRLQDISELFAANEIPLVGLGAFAFVFLFRRMNPLSHLYSQGIVRLYQLRNVFVPRLLQGMILGCGFVAALLLGGVYRYVGVFLQIEEGMWGVVSVLLRGVSIVLMVFYEEFIFRKKILTKISSYFSTPFSILLSAIMYCVAKWVQFDLGWSQLLTLFLVGLSLAMRAVIEGSFLGGAGLWAGLLLAFHPLFSLPVFGDEYQGVFLLRYEMSWHSAADVIRLVSGGFGGPLSSLGFQALFWLDIGRRFFRDQKVLLNFRAPHLK